jgi:cation-transporting ATPase E
MQDNITKLQGLTKEEVQQRTSQGLQNKYEPRPTRSYFRIISDNIFTFYNLLLMASITLLIILHGSKDVLFSTILLICNIFLSLSQELRAKHTLDKLILPSKPTIIARREGENKKIPASEIVTDDILLLKAGDPIIVDGKVITSIGLEIDESSITGESKYVAKNTGDTLTSGSYIVAGSGMMLTQKVGKESTIHHLQRVAGTYKTNQTPLEKRVKILLRLMMIIIAIFGPLTFIAGINVELTFAQAVENLVNLLLSLLPQGLITSITILLTYGAIRVSKSHAIIQRINSIESMGNIKVLCADKTGTLTKNRLTVEEIIPLTNEKSAERLSTDLSRFAHAVSSPNQTITALVAYLKKTTPSPHAIIEVPFSSSRKWSGISLPHTSFILGAPETILANQDILPYQKNKIAELYNKGLRLLVFARSRELLDMQNKLLPKDIHPLALIALSDIIRNDVRETLQKFTDLGITVKIISGDNEKTVAAIANKAGIKNINATTQRELMPLNKHVFDKTIESSTLFARIDPQMKRNIIQSLIKQGKYPAMIGDGINDVLALKKAKVSIAMNSGAQVTKDISDIILLKNTFSTLLNAITEGRDIIQRIYAIAKIFFVKVIYLLLLFLLVGFANLPFPVTLRQTTLLGFIISGIPLLLITFKILTPVKHNNPGKNFIEFTALAGTIGGFALAYLFIITMTLLKLPFGISTTLVTVLAQLYSMVVLWKIIGVSPFDPKSVIKHKNETLLIGLLGSLSITTTVLLFPYIFHLTHLQPMHWALVIGIATACAYFLWLFDGKLNIRKIWRSLYK